MSKCSQCRKADVLDSRWDKLRLYFFHFFHNDIIDLSQNKFTQGFADGYKKGREDEKEASNKHMAEFTGGSEFIPNIALPIVELEKVVTEKNGKIYLNQVPIDKQKLADLKQEAHLFRNSSLWDLITNTLHSRAYEQGWHKGKTMDDLVVGRSISATVQIQQEIINKIEKAV